MESFKTEEKKAESEKPKPRFLRLMDEDNVEIKKITEEDIEECVKVMRKCGFDVTEAEVRSIVVFNMSYAAAVNRMIVGVGLSWPAHFDVESKKILGGEPNSLYCEDPAVLLAYEGRGIRRILVKEREKGALESGFKYTLAYLSEDLPKGDITEYLRESASQLEKLYLSENYEFAKSERGLLAYKKIAPG
ncbi:hypothetical protein HY988_06880 [Candidatus Micrarchaeota archaeon]|nr:hypothetical protein [Candidatus Micrarchaeota archaeon]